MNMDEMGTLITRIDVRTESTHELVKDHETRIRSGEKFRWLAMGAFGLVSALGTWGFFL